VFCLFPEFQCCKLNTTNFLLLQLPRQLRKHQAFPELPRHFRKCRISANACDIMIDRVAIFDFERILLRRERDNIFLPQNINVAHRDRLTSSPMETSKCQGQLNETGLWKKGLSCLTFLFLTVASSWNLLWSKQRYRRRHKKQTTKKTKKKQATYIAFVCLSVSVFVCFCLLVSLCVCVCECICVCQSMCVCLCVCLYVCMWVCLCFLSVGEFVCVSVSVFVCVCVCVRKTECVFKRLYVCVSLFVCLCVYICVLLWMSKATKSKCILKEYQKTDNKRKNFLKTCYSDHACIVWIFLCIFKIFLEHLHSFNFFDEKKIVFCFQFRYVFSSESIKTWFSNAST